MATAADIDTATKIGSVNKRASRTGLIRDGLDMSVCGGAARCWRESIDPLLCESAPNRAFRIGKNIAIFQLDVPLPESMLHFPWRRYAEAPASILELNTCPITKSIVPLC